jgi:glycosyltransferase involved in cell wall biosynthesis
MRLLILTTQRLSDLSGINTYLVEFVREARSKGRDVELLSSAECTTRKLWDAIGRSDWVHLNTADPISFLLAKIRQRKVIQRFHYTFWGSTHTEDFVERGFLKRFRLESRLRLTQSDITRPRSLAWLGEQGLRLLFRILVGLGSDRTVTCSHFLTRALELPRDSFTIYYPFRLADQPIDSPKARFMLFCGRVDGPKGLKQTFDALKLLQGQGHTLKFTIAGDGPAREELERVADTHGISTWITWLGRVRTEDVTRLMCQAQFLIVPSISNDPSPFVVLEAAHGATAVIGSSRGGIPEEVGEGGWIVDPNSAQKLAGAILEAWSSPEECAVRGKKLRAHVQQRFDPSKSVDAMFALMDDPRRAIELGALPHRGSWTKPS